MVGVLSVNAEHIEQVGATALWIAVGKTELHQGQCHIPVLLLESRQYKLNRSGSESLRDRSQFLDTLATTQAVYRYLTGMEVDCPPGASQSKEQHPLGLDPIRSPLGGQASGGINNNRLLSRSGSQIDAFSIPSSIPSNEPNAIWQCPTGAAGFHQPNYRASYLSDRLRFFDRILLGIQFELASLPSQVMLAYWQLKQVNKDIRQFFLDRNSLLGFSTPLFESVPPAIETFHELGCLNSYRHRKILQRVKGFYSRSEANWATACFKSSIHVSLSNIGIL